MSGRSQAQRGLQTQRRERARDGEQWDQRRVVETGNSVAVTIPEGLRKLLGLDLGDEVTIYKCDGGYYVEADGDE
jgi:hypothetical protein